MGLTKKFTLTVAEVMGVLLANDGAGSEIDADMVDGLHASEIINKATTAVTDLSSYTGVHNKIPLGSEDGTLDSSWFPDDIGGSDIPMLGNWYVGPYAPDNAEAPYLLLETDTEVETSNAVTLNLVDSEQDLNVEVNDNLYGVDNAEKTTTSTSDVEFILNL